MSGTKRWPRHVVMWKSSRGQPPKTTTHATNAHSSEITLSPALTQVLCVHSLPRRQLPFITICEKCGFSKSTISIKYDSGSESFPPIFQFLAQTSFQWQKCTWYSGSVINWCQILCNFRSTLLYCLRAALLRKRATQHEAYPITSILFRVHLMVRTD